MRDTFIAGLIELAQTDDSVALLTGDLGFGVVEKFQEKFPDRFWNCGVAEQSMMSIAAGLAKSGMRPFVYSIANFPTFRCLEQVRNDVCYHNLPVTVVSVGGGLGYGTLGYTHHGIEDIAVMRVLPNMNVFSPADPLETMQVLTKIYQLNAPSYLRLGKNGEPKIEDVTNKVLSGSIKELKTGSDLTIVSCGSITENCLSVAKQLNEEINVQVISVSQIQPLEIDFLLSVINSMKVLIVEEHVQRGGLASAFFENIYEKSLNLEIAHLHIDENKISQTGTQEFLRGLSGLDKSGIKAKCLELIKN